MAEQVGVVGAASDARVGVAGAADRGADDARRRGGGVGVQPAEGVANRERHRRGAPADVRAMCELYAGDARAGRRAHRLGRRNSGDGLVAVLRWCGPRPGRPALQPGGHRLPAPRVRQRVGPHPAANSGVRDRAARAPPGLRRRGAGPPGRGAAAPPGAVATVAAPTATARRAALRGGAAVRGRRPGDHGRATPAPAGGGPACRTSRCGWCRSLPACTPVVAGAFVLLDFPHNSPAAPEPPIVYRER